MNEEIVRSTVSKSELGTESLSVRIYKRNRGSKHVVQTINGDEVEPFFCYCSNLFEDAINEFSRRINKLQEQEDPVST